MVNMVINLTDITTIILDIKYIQMRCGKPAAVEKAGDVIILRCGTAQIGVKIHLT